MVRVVAQDAQRRGAEREVGAIEDGQANPARAEDAPELAMGEERDSPVELTRPGEKSIGAVGGLLGHFSRRATVPENVPAGAPLANILRAPSFVIAIIPFGELRFDFRFLVESNQRTGFSGALAGAAQHPGERNATQTLSQLLGLGFAVCGQRNVGASGVLMGERPGRFTVPDKIKAEGHVGSR